MSKHLYLFLVFYLISNFIFSQAVFGPQQILTDEVANPTFLKMADMNNDGYTDVIANSGQEGKDLVWFRNLNNNGFARQETLIHFNCNPNSFPNRIEVVDFDSDGQMDILRAYQNKISVFINDNLSFDEEIIICDTLTNVINVKLADVDGDDDWDIVLINNINEVHQICYFENDGDNNFTDAHIIEHDMVWCSEILLDDLDNDGDVDLLTNSGSTAIIYHNDGSGNFSSFQSITNYGDYGSSFCFADVDNDNDKDIVAGVNSESYCQMKWYENDGEGGFNPNQTIYLDSLLIISLCESDWDGDGDMDIIGGSSYSSKIILFENDGSGEFEASELWNDFLISGNPYMKFAVSGNVDNDVEDEVFFVVDFMNPGLDIGEINILQRNDEGEGEVSSLARSISCVRSLAVADIDLNNYADVIYSSADWCGGNPHVGYLKNFSQFDFSTALAIDEELDNVIQICTSDADSDNDEDIFGYGYEGVFKIENRLNNQFETTLLTDAYGEVLYQGMDIGDMDGDGIADVLYPDVSGDEKGIFWLKGDGNGEFVLMDPIDTDIDFVVSVFLADIDSDDDNDIVATCFVDNQIIWYENLSDGNFGSKNLISDEYPLPQSLSCDDMDGDGDIDILVSYYAFENNGSSWFENDGNANFEIHHIFDTTGINLIHTRDLDNDGLCEIIFSTFGEESQIAYSYNNGDGIFSEPIYLDDIYDYLHCFIAADLNNDGDKEIVVGDGNGSGKITFYPNLLVDNLPENISKNQYFCYPNPVKEILFVKGLKQNDVVEVYDSKGVKVLTSKFSKIIMQNYSEGLYLVLIKDENGRIVKSDRIIKK